MANLAAKRPDYDGPDVATRFPPGHRSPGRTSSRWIRDRLNSAARSGDKTEREEILDHLLEVAKLWEVRVVGRDSHGELLKVASARDSVEAAKILFAYDMGKPPADPDEWLMKLAEHMRSVARDQIEVARTILGKRLETMDDAQVAAFLKTCDQDTRRFLVAASMVMSGQQPEQISATPPAEPTTAQPSTANEASRPEAGCDATGVPTDTAPSGSSCDAGGVAPISTAPLAQPEGSEDE